MPDVHQGGPRLRGGHNHGFYGRHSKNRFYDISSGPSSEIQQSQAIKYHGGTNVNQTELYGKMRRKILEQWIPIDMTEPCNE